MQPRTEPSLAWRRGAAFAAAAILAIGLALRAPAAAAPPPTPAPEPFPSSGWFGPSEPVFLDGHGWLVLRDRPMRAGPTPGSAEPAGPDRTIVLHLPPRIGGDDDNRGVIRYAPGFANPVDALAWHDNRVWFVLKPERMDNGKRVRRVLGLSAARTIAQNFEYVPPRPESLAPLPAGVAVAGLAGTRMGPLVLLSERKPAEGAPPRFSLKALFGSAWTDVPLPWESGSADAPPAPDASSRLHIVSQRDGFALVLTRPGDPVADLFIGRTTAGAADDRGPTGLVTWLPPQTRQLESPAGDPDRFSFIRGGSPGEDAFLRIHPDPDGKGLLISSLRAGGALPLPAQPDVPSAAWIVPMASPGSVGAGSLVFVWRADPAGNGTTPVPATPTDLRVRELSALTGRSLYNGPARELYLITSREYHALAVLLVLIMVAVVVFVLRAEPGRSPALPAEVMPAGMPRRLIAAALDYIPAALIASAVFGLDPGGLLRLSSMLTGHADARALGLALAIAAAHCTIFEWLFGRSLGKAITGCRVIPVTLVRTPDGEGLDGQEHPEARDQPPRLWQAAVRNLVRWSMPVLGLFILLDSLGRHPGDLAARTVVVVDSPEQEPA